MLKQTLMKAQAKAQTHTKPLSTKEKLIQAARTLFSQKGFKGTTVSEITEAAGVNVSLVSHYFDGKEGLFRECVQGFDEARLDAIDRMLLPAKSLEEFRFRLQFATEELLRFHLGHRETSKIFYAQLMFGAGIPDPNVEKNWLRFNSKLIRFFEEARKSGFLREDVDPKVVAGLLYLSLSQILQYEYFTAKGFGLQIKTEDQRKKLIESLVDIVMNGASASRVPTQRGLTQ